LFVCHQQNLFHGLLKPSNILVDADQHVHVLDFGLGAILAASTADQSLFNTQGEANLLTSGLDCASPESIMDSSNLAATGDQYSLGCVLYFCLADRYPFEGQPVEKMVGHQSKQPTPLLELNPDVRKDLGAIVARLMQKSPAARYPDAGEAAKALRPLAFVPSRRAVPLAPITSFARPSAAVAKFPTRETLAAVGISAIPNVPAPPVAEITPPPSSTETDSVPIPPALFTSEAPSKWVQVIGLLCQIAIGLAFILIIIFLAWRLFLLLR
jgi:serine/threonine protein kinase